MADILEKQGEKALVRSVVKAIKNGVSLLLSKRKRTAPAFLCVYLPMNVAESICDTRVPTVPSDDDTSMTSANEIDETLSNVSDDQTPASYTQF